MKRKYNVLALSATAVLCAALCGACAGTRFSDGDAARKHVDPVSAVYAVPADASVWDGDLAAAGWDPDSPATAPSTYVVDDSAATVSIGSAAALAYFSHEVYADTAHDLDGYTVTLECDIDLGGDSNIWIPIGSTKRSSNPTRRFAGTFDGNGHTVYNLTSQKFYDNMRFGTSHYIAYEKDGATLEIPFEIDGTEYCYGLFGTVANFTATDLSVCGVEFDLPQKTADGKTFKTDSIGAIFGYGTGSITMRNCVAGSENGGDCIRNVLTAGGMIGRIYAYNHDGSGTTAPYRSVVFDNCVNHIDVGGADNGEKKGGIAGFVQFYSDFAVTDCVNYGDVVGTLSCGGITSYVSGHTQNANLGDITLARCVNYGDVIGNNSGIAGGMIGSVQLIAGNDIGVITVSDCINRGTVKGGQDAGGMFGWFQNKPTEVYINDCFNYGDIICDGSCGGIIGRNGTSAPDNISGGSCGAIVSSTVNKGACVGTAGTAVNSEYFANAGRIASSTAAISVRAATEKAELELSDDGKTVLGLKTAPSGKYSAEIPAGAESVAFAAFIGQKNLVELTFAEGGKLNSIGDWAFAGTGVAEVELPEGLTTLGAAAFGECSALTEVALPRSLADIGQAAFGNCARLGDIDLKSGAAVKAVGKYAFDAKVNVLAQNAAQYKELATSFGVSNFTYPVKVSYNYLGTVLDSVTRLYGRNYNYVLDNKGEWVTDESLTDIGTPHTGALVWYADPSCTGDAVQMTKMNELLDSSDCGDEIKLYATGKQDGKYVFVARDSIVFDERVSYAPDELNPLLAAASDPILPSMNVSIAKFTDPDGVVKTVNRVGDAGSYEISITSADGEVYMLNINIARKAVDLGSYENLFWKLVRVGDQTVDAELRNAEGLTVYLYKTADGKVVPAYTQLTAEQAAEAGVNVNEYTTKTVRYSVVRNRGNDTPVTIELTDNPAYTAAYTDNVKTAVGMYTATVRLEATANYILAMAGARPSDATTRGVNVEIAQDGRSAAVDKVWYIVDINNWFVGSAGNDEYRINNRIYGDTSVVSAPRLMYGDGTDHVRFELYRGNERIGEIFTADEFEYYINSVMPAGEYRLVAHADEITAEEYDESDVAHEHPRTVTYSAFSRTFVFTVDKTVFSDGDIEKINDMLKGKRFSYVWEENISRLYDVQTAADIETLLGGFINPERRNTVWDNVMYDYCYGGAEILFNLSRMQSDMYYTANELAPTNAPDKYIVYYCISMPNYYSSVESAQSGKRTDYFFEVVIVREIALPSIASKTYNGSVLTADVSGNSVYSVKTNKGGTAAGKYAVVFSFNEPDYYMWQGQSIESKTAEYTLEFEITKAVNDWKILPTVQNWVEGKFDAAENKVVGEALFGKPRIIITDAADNVIYDSLAGVNVLESAESGAYKLTAVVADTYDYNGLTYSVFVHVFDVEGLPWWIILVIVLGALGIAAAVFGILVKKGVLQILTGKIVIAIRARATVDATIAAVRANKRAEEAKRSIAEANKREALAARRAKAKAERMKPLDEKAAALEAKAQAQAERAEKMRMRAEAMQARALSMKERAATQNAQSDAARPESSAVGEANQANNGKTESEE